MRLKMRLRLRLWPSAKITTCSSSNSNVQIYLHDIHQSTFLSFYLRLIEPKSLWTICHTESVNSLKSHLKVLRNQNAFHHRSCPKCLWLLHHCLFRRCSFDRMLRLRHSPNSKRQYNSEGCSGVCLSLRCFNLPNTFLVYGDDLITTLQRKKNTPTSGSLFPPTSHLCLPGIPSRSLSTYLRPGRMHTLRIRLRWWMRQ